MTEAEKDAWDAMLDALNQCADVLATDDRIRGEVLDAIGLAEKARDQIEGASDMPESVAHAMLG